MTARRTQIGRIVSTYLNPLARLPPRALVYLSVRHQTSHNQRRLSLSLLSSSRSHYLPRAVRSPGTPRKLSCCVIVVICRKSRSLKFDFHKAPLMRSCSEDKLHQRPFGEPFEDPQISSHRTVCSPGTPPQVATNTLPLFTH